MTTYSEKNSKTLLTGATDADGDPVTVRRINGTLIASWPVTFDLDHGRMTVAQNGAVTYDDEGSTAGHPTGGQTQTNGSFTFTLWDGIDESPTYTATVRLDGQNSPPTGQSHTLVFQV